MEAKDEFFQQVLVPSEGGELDTLLPMRFAYELARFVELYSSAFSTQETILDQAKQDCDCFRTFPFYEHLVLVWNHICVHQTKDTKTRGKVSIEALETILKRNRDLLESLSASSVQADQFLEHYGTKPFKCPVVFCFYFHEGFSGKKVRDKHVDCHERPFQCEVEDCGIRGLGLASNKALEKHMRTFHPEQCDLSESFAQLNRKASPAKWPCDLCDKTFTRSHNLKAHQYNHAGKKPHLCSECGKGFARKNDVRRHEEIHNRWR